VKKQATTAKPGLGLPSRAPMPSLCLVRSLSSAGIWRKRHLGYWLTCPWPCCKGNQIINYKVHTEVEARRTSQRELRQCHGPCYLPGSPSSSTPLSRHRRQSCRAGRLERHARPLGSGAGERSFKKPEPDRYIWIVDPKKRFARRRPTTNCIHAHRARPALSTRAHIERTCHRVLSLPQYSHCAFPPCGRDLGPRSMGKSSSLAQSLRGQVY
jgi:hypothetical protein